METRGHDIAVRAYAHIQAPPSGGLMGYELRRWLADRLPTGLSPGERLVALEVADLANDGTRRAFGTTTLDTLVRRTGYADIEQVGKVLAKLALRGLELRVPVMRGGRPVVKKSGHLLFACNGHELNFLVPDESCPALVKPSRSRDLESQCERAGFDEEARVDEDEARVLTSESPHDQKVKPACSRDPSPQSPQEISSSLLSPTGRADVTNPPPGEREDLQREEQPQPPVNVPTVPDIPAELVAEVMEKTTATAEEFARIIADARRDGVRRPRPWLRSDVGAADFRQRLDDLRAGVGAGPSVPVPPPVSDYWAAARNACEHGTPGGAARCALCRTQAPARPPLAESQAPTPAIPQDLTALRETLSSFTTRSGPRRPALDIRPRTAPETPPEVAAAHATLARHGNAFDLMTAARKRLGDQAHRDEVVVLAAELARDR